eukprot:3370401-Amphidinium_carterae.1
MMPAQHPRHCSPLVELKDGVVVRGNDAVPHMQRRLLTLPWTDQAIPQGHCHLCVPMLTRMEAIQGRQVAGVRQAHSR